MKKYTYFFMSMIVLTLGLLMLLFQVDLLVNFIFIAIGVVGAIATSSILISQSNSEKGLNEKEEFSKNSLKESENIKAEKELIEEPLDENSNKPKQDKDAVRPKLKESVNNKQSTHSTKIHCKYCKCRFNSSLDKCPNCGAPVVSTETTKPKKTESKKTK